ncbi:hypothetical protein CISG_05899 [Coccidioides immitis RMSCC 3703]|uniref:Uncharacterized protein n=2 Tax=Coccidioides TaxID=5500 RepID=A0A0J8QWA0_COCIT|nr:hypothetical protein CPC735_001480 [Coccidioides posadasii C735 delta SOWgp]EER24803.1 hypothetical protein CPC735_001480 [Coccidioides posadasii C735 delta SOWgp]KMU76756.1 hypothetical protein CISG_05899 [Coccidioides immitis RMSCC 3703]|eukprot:XP_003066948.1 hypothetical protein CPC735_001480 [Coccidioides posadasii C735 delta SOWgp]
MTINYGQGTPSAPSRGYQLYITALVMVLVAALFVFARIFSRIATKRVGLDDYLVIAALVRGTARRPACCACVAQFFFLNRYLTLSFVSGIFGILDSEHQPRQVFHLSVHRQPVMLTCSNSRRSRIWNQI